MFAEISCNFNYTEEKAKDVLIFYFNKLLDSICQKHSPNPNPECTQCKEETKVLEAFRGMASIIKITGNFGEH